jgi:hypothetical protein
MVSLLSKSARTSFASSPAALTRTKQLTKSARHFAPPQHPSIGPRAPSSCIRTIAQRALASVKGHLPHSPLSRHTRAPPALSAERGCLSPIPAAPLDSPEHPTRLCFPSRGRQKRAAAGKAARTRAR